MVTSRAFESPGRILHPSPTGWEDDGKKSNPSAGELPNLTNRKEFSAVCACLTCPEAGENTDLQAILFSHKPQKCVFCDCRWVEHSGLVQPGPTRRET